MKKEEDIELIIDWKNALNEIITCIEKATESIRIRIFMWRDDECWNLVLDKLNEKIDENKNISIRIEKDIFWSKMYNIQKFLTWWRIWWDIFSTKKWENFKKRKNVEFIEIWSWSVIFFKYLKENNHSKIYLFDEKKDERIAITGWMNIADNYLKDLNKNDPDKWWWHDYMVKMKWENAAKLAWIKTKTKWPHRKIRESVEIIQDIKDKRVTRKEFLKELRKAKKEIIIEHSYITDWSIIILLRKKMYKWVKVTIILPDRSDWIYHANMHSIKKLLKPSLIYKKPNKINIYLYKWMIHAKVMMIDNSTVIIWSANLTYNSFDILCETNAIFRNNKNLNKKLTEQLNKDIKNSNKINYSKIPKYNKLLAYIQKMFV